jgi:hypothetical protein
VDDDGRLVPYSVPDDHPDAAAISHARTFLAATGYRMQADDLKADYLERGIDALVPSITVAASDDDALCYTVTSWDADVPAHLPQTDFVDIGERRWAWDELARSIELIPLPGVLPPRYAARAHPAATPERRS